MTEYVNKTDALDAIKCQSGYMTDYTIGVSLEEVEDIFDELPTTGIIRCKDCKHCVEYCRIVNDVMTTLACDLFYENDYCRLRVHENDFCSFAEEKTE